jgi:hypothetical protein
MDDKQKKALMIGGGVVGAYLVYKLYQNHAANTASTASSGALAPNATTSSDPYSSQYAALSGQEQSDAAALQGQNAQLASDLQALAGRQSTDETALGNLPTTIQSQLSGWLSQLGFTPTPAQSPTLPIATVAPLAQGQVSLGGTQGLTNTVHGTTVSPGVALNNALHTVMGISGQSAQAFLSGILSGSNPYHKVAGTTQSGGLAATGTYVRKGAPTYFAFSDSGVLHIRQAV